MTCPPTTHFAQPILYKIGIFKLIHLNLHIEMIKPQTKIEIKCEVNLTPGINYIAHKYFSEGKAEI